MNIEQLIEVAAEAITKQPERMAKNYWLVIRRSELLCVPATCLKHDDIHVYLLTNQQFNEGLTNADWTAIGMKLFKVFTELKL